MMSKFYNNAKTAVFLVMMTALILYIGSFFGQRGMVIAIAMAAIGNIGAFFFSDKLALMSVGAQEVGPEHRLYQIVQRLAQRANLPMPRVYISPQPAPNAFATGRSPKHAAVCATQGLLQMLNENEVAGVMAHELAHVKHRDILIVSVAATIGGAIGYLGYMMRWSGGRDRDGNSNLLAAILMPLLGSIAAMIIQMAISRSREYNADKEGATICGDPLYLASALEKIHHGASQIPMDVNPSYNSLFIAEPLSVGRSLANLFSTHPPLEKRLVNLIGRAAV